MPDNGYIKWYSDMPTLVDVDQNGVVKAFDSSKGAVIQNWIDNEVKPIPLVGKVIATVLEKALFNDKVDIDSSNSTLTLIAQYDYQNTKLEDLIDCIIEGNKSSNLNFNLSSKWTKVGVAAETYKGKTYIAITLQVKRT